MITYILLNKHTEIAHFCTTRVGGASVGNYASNNLSPFTGDNPSAVLANQTNLTNELRIPVQHLVIPYQNHGTEIQEIETEYFQLSDYQKNDYLFGVDALFTTLPNICIGVTTADCVPLLFFDPEIKVVAAAHAGWRGTCGRIAEKTVRAMIEKYNCNPANILVTIGPSISQQVYEVGMEVVENFESAGFDIGELVSIRDTRIFFDLWAANRQSLLAVGVLSQNIETAGICTYSEHERFFSARKFGLKSGRILSGIMVMG
jgi:YfiH family protein